MIVFSRITVLKSARAGVSQKYLTSSDHPYAITKPGISVAAAIGFGVSIFSTVLALMLGYFFGIDTGSSDGSPKLFAFALLLGSIIGIATTFIAYCRFVEDESLAPGAFELYTSHRTVRDTYFRKR